MLNYRSIKSKVKTLTRSLLAGAVDAKTKVLKFTDSSVLAHQTDFKTKNICKGKLLLTFQGP